MTEQEFLTELEKTPRRWQVTPLQHIRLQGFNHCPLEAVILREPLLREPIEWLEVEIMAAADNINTSHFPERLTLRSKLLRACGLATMLLTLTTSAFASPVLLTTGTWIAAPLPAEDGSTPYSHISWDGSHLNAGYIIGPTPDLEYLSGAGFILSGIDWTEIFSLTAYTTGALTEADGLFSYDNAHGAIRNSVGAGWENFVLFRRRNNATSTTYWIAIEDLPRVSGDNDYNDRIVTGTGLFNDSAPPICAVDCNPSTVPEPVAMLLLGFGLLCARKRRVW